MSAATSSDSMSHLSGILDNEQAINERLTLIEQSCHLISPSTSCALPPGCAVAFTVVRIDPKVEAHSVGYGKYSLLKPALLKLANAAGICWNASASYRVDPGTAPHYVHWHAEGAWRGLDGTVLPVVGDLQMDLRDGSDQAIKVMESARADTEKERIAKGLVTLRDMRAKILEHAQSKAMMRGIRAALGLRSYTDNELKKPFVAVRLVFLGHDEDPVIERENKRAIRANMLGGAAALFGAAPAVQHRALVGADDAPELLEAPLRAKALPMPAPSPTPAAVDMPAQQGTAKQEAPTAAGDPPATPAPAPTPRPETPARRSATREPTEDDDVMRFGLSKGQSISQAGDADLAWYAAAVERQVSDPAKARYREQNERHLANVRAEIARRGESGESDGFAPAVDPDDNIPF